MWAVTVLSATAAGGECDAEGRWKGPRCRARCGIGRLCAHGPKTGKADDVRRSAVHPKPSSSVQHPCTLGSLLYQPLSGKCQLYDERNPALESGNRKGPQPAREQESDWCDGYVCHPQLVLAHHQHLQRYTVYQLATVDGNHDPRSRTVVHRDFLHPEGAPHLPILLTTTDVRSPKVSHIRGHPRVEATWWMCGSQDQFRIVGPVRVVPPPALKAAAVSGSSNESIALNRLDEQGFDWEKKRLAVFDTMSAHMKASWCCPPPGTVIASYEESKTWPQAVPKLGEAETDGDKRNQEQALGNFALLLIEAVEVDWLQLAEKPNRRTRFIRSGEDWKEELIVP